MRVTRRTFIKGAAAAGALATLPPLWQPERTKSSRQPASVGLKYRGDEVTGTGYTRKALDGVDWNGWAWEASDVTWTSAVFTADEVVVYDNNDNSLGSLRFPSASVVAGDFTIRWHPKGVLLAD